MRSRLLALGLAAPVLLATAGVGTAGPAAAATSDDGLLGHQDPASYYTGAFPQSLALLGVAAGGQGSAPQAKAAVGWLLRQQCPDGGWQYYRADLTKPCTPPNPAAFSGEDTNSTAVATEALAALGVTPTFDALAFLRKAQNADGGFGYVPGAASDPDSTGLVAQALVSRGVDPASWRAGGASPYDALLDFQLGCAAPAADRGAFFFDRSSPTPNVLATAQAVPGLAGVAYPLKAGSIATTSPQPTCAKKTATRLTTKRAGKRPSRRLATDPAVAASYGATWLASQVTAAGYVKGPGGPDYGNTAYAVLAMAATRTNKAAVDRGAAYLLGHVDVAVTDDKGEDKVANLGLLAMVAAATGSSDATTLATRILGNCTGTCTTSPSPTPAPTSSASPTPSPGPTASTAPSDGADVPAAAELPSDGTTLPFTGAETALMLLVAGALVAAGVGARLIGARR